MAISTYGKAIKQGWDWLGITPAHPDKISGLIEVPKLAESLTLNKSDFSGGHNAGLLEGRTAKGLEFCLHLPGALGKGAEKQSPLAPPQATPRIAGVTTLGVCGPDPGVLQSTEK